MRQLCRANNEAIIFLKSGGLIYCLRLRNEEPQTWAEAGSSQKNISSKTDAQIMYKCIYRSFCGETDCRIRDPGVFASVKPPPWIQKDIFKLRLM